MKLRTSILLTSLCISLTAPQVLLGQMTPSVPTNSWLFDDGTGTTAAAGNGSVDGTLNGNVSFSVTETFNGTGSSLEFPGDTGDNVDFAGLNNTFNGNSELSLSFWIKASATEVDQAWFSMNGNSGQDVFDLRYDSAVFGGTNTNTIAASIGSDTEANLDDSIFYGQSGHQTTDWQHVAFTFNGNNSVGDRYKLYVDGAQDTNPDSISTMNLDPSSGGVGTAIADQVAFLLGDGAKGNWDGFIDETAVWETELSASEISWLADSTNSLSAIPEPSAFAVFFGMVALGLLLRRRR